MCEGDEIVVNVYNAMETSEGTTIHWHGLLQEGTPHMDGVNLVTQCAIAQQSTFQYRSVLCYSTEHLSVQVSSLFKHRAPFSTGQFSVSTQTTFQYR